MKMYLLGIAHGTSLSNAYVSRKTEAFYCPPGNVGLIGYQYMAIFEAYLEKSPRDRSNPAGMVMLLALRDAFPCGPTLSNEYVEGACGLSYWDRGNPTYACFGPDDCSAGNRDKGLKGDPDIRVGIVPRRVV